MDIVPRSRLYARELDFALRCALDQNWVKNFQDSAGIQLALLTVNPHAYLEHAACCALRGQVIPLPHETAAPIACALERVRRNSKHESRQDRRRQDLVFVGVPAKVAVFAESRIEAT